jgi:hypothetical protein
VTPPDLTGGTVRKLPLLLLALLAARMVRRAVRKQAEVSGLLWALIALTACSTANTSKTYAMEQRVNLAVAAIGAANGTAATQAAQISALQAQVAQLQEGTFTNVGGTTVQLTGGPGNLYVTALQYWNSQSQVDFLNTVHPESKPASPGTAPGSYSSSFEQANYTAGINNIIAQLQNAGIFV